MAPCGEGVTWGKLYCIGSYWLLPVPTGSYTNVLHTSSFWSTEETHVWPMKSCFDPNWKQLWLMSSGFRGLHFWTCLTHLQQLDRLYFLFHTVRDTCTFLPGIRSNTFPICPCFLPPSQGKVRKWAYALTSGVNRPAEPQTGCWLARPQGRQHVWHHAPRHIWMSLPRS